MVIVHGTFSNSDGVIQKFVLQSNDKRTLGDIDYNLNPIPHERNITQLENGLYEMTVTAPEMSEILSGFACRD